MTHHTKPIIGISTSLEENSAVLSLEYVDAVETAGGTPVILPPSTCRHTAARLSEMLDGVIITGGPAVSLHLVGTLPDDLPSAPERRVQSDLRMVDVCASSNKPLLGICYGMQLLNAWAGGSIYADVQKQVAGALVHSATRGAPPHSIRVSATSWLFSAMQRDELMVSTNHIQAIASLGSGFVAVAFAPDGMIEAIENQSASMTGVQFHPERMGEPMRPLFEAFITRCRGGAAYVP